MARALRLSIVIPAYNEEDHIGQCLTAIANQTVKPFQVIVVDNNSADRTAQIAKSFDFVTLVSEKRKGIPYARSAGFDAAKGDIIGRLDADVVPNPDWIERIISDFKNDKVGAVAGLFMAPLLRDGRFGYVRHWSLMYILWSNSYFGVPILCGGNMAFRRKLWQDIRRDAHMDTDFVHDDQDVSLLIAAQGAKVVLDSKLIAFMDDASHSDWPKFMIYMRKRWRTKDYHISRGTIAQARAKGTTLPMAKRAAILVLIALPGLPFVIGTFLIGLPGMVKRTAFSRAKI